MKRKVKRPARRGRIPVRVIRRAVALAKERREKGNDS